MANQHKLIFFIGSYTEMLAPDFGGTGGGIYTVSLDTHSGEIVHLHTRYAVNPSYLVISEDNQFLYCNTEVSKDNAPVVQCYRIKDDFSLEFINERAIDGGFPCHIQKLDNSILVACYETGNALQFPLDTEGHLLDCTKNFQHNGSSINIERQEGPHAHQSAIHPSGKDVYVADFGIDTLKAYSLEDQELCENQTKDVHVEKGNGPRHIVFNENGDLGYIINELSGEVMIMALKGNKYKVIASKNSLPPSFKGIPSASAIRIHPTGKYLYAANRGADAITIFEIKEEKLEILDYHFTGGLELREFNISPDGQWLIACHQDSHGVVSYKIGPDGQLIEMHRTREMKSPVCVSFL